MNFGFKVFLILLVVVLIGISGAMDQADYTRGLAHKCRMIESGVWPEEVEPRCGGRK